MLCNIVDGVLTLEEIVAEVSTVEEDEVGNSEGMDIEEVEELEPLITRQEAQSALNVVRRYVQQKYADPAILKHSDALDEIFYQERKKNAKQSTLTDFFSIV
jgi:hypothetical protein